MTSLQIQDGGGLLIRRSLRGHSLSRWRNLVHGIR